MTNISENQSCCQKTLDRSRYCGTQLQCPNLALADDVVKDREIHPGMTSIDQGSYSGPSMVFMSPMMFTGRPS
jgi:hypothetical protein